MTREKEEEEKTVLGSDTVSINNLEGKTENAYTKFVDDGQ